MPGCAMYGCKNYSRKTKGSDIKYYSFPKDDNLAQKWTDACNRQDKFITKHAYICSLHFDKSCFQTLLKHELLNYIPRNNRNLKPDAVPQTATVAIRNTGKKLRKYRNTSSKDKGVKKRTQQEKSCQEVSPNHEPSSSSSQDQPVASTSQVGDDSDSTETCLKLETECDLGATEIWPKEDLPIASGHREAGAKPELEYELRATELLHCEDELGPGSSTESSVASTGVAQAFPKLECETSATEIWPKFNLKHEPCTDQLIENARETPDEVIILKDRILTLEHQHNHLLKLNRNLSEQKINALSELYKVKDMVPENVTNILSSCFSSGLLVEQIESGSSKRREHSGDDSEDGHPTKEEAWQNLAEGLDSNEYHLNHLIDQVTNTDPTVTLKKLDEIASAITRHAVEFKRTVEDMKEVINRQVEKFERDKEAAVLQARVEAQVAALQPENNDTTLQPALDHENQKKCANCNREALAECSLCRRTPYCSTFCQRKDWGSHQVECVRGVTTDNQQQSIMLIVESTETQ